MAFLIAFVGQLGYVGVDFCLERGGQHPSRALADDLIDQGGAVGGARVAPITMGMDRPAQRIADETVRRLLPDSPESLVEALKETRIAEQHRRASAVMNRRLGSVLPGLSAAGSPRHPEPARFRSYWYRGQYSQGPTPVLASGNVALRADATHMALELTDVPAELGLRILEMLRSSPLLEGVVTGRAIEPAQAALPRAEQLIPGELVDRTRSTDAGPARRPCAPSPATAVGAEASSSARTSPWTGPAGCSCATR